MKLRKISGGLAAAALALMAFASTASATTLEVGGVKQTSSVTFEATLRSGTSLLQTDTSKAFANTCTGSKMHGETATSFTATGTNPVGGPITSLSFGPTCTHEKLVVHKPGSLSVERISTTTNGTVRSNGAEITVPETLLGVVVNLNCKTENTDLGTLTGVASGNATLDINAVLNCGSALPSAKWEGTYTITSPAGLGVIE